MNTFIDPNAAKDYLEIDASSKVSDSNESHPPPPPPPPPGIQEVSIQCHFYVIVMNAISQAPPATPLETLILMGIDEAQARRALRRTRGNIEQAIAHIFG